MRILGLAFDYHDAAAALVIDGVVVSAIQEERLSRVKHDRRFPRLAIKHCLAAGRVRVHELDAVVYYENPFRKFERIARSSLVRSRLELSKVVDNWLAEGKFNVVDRIAQDLSVPRSRVFLCNHHCSHAAAAFFCSPFDEATIVTIDGVGEFETASVSLGQGNRVVRLSHVNFPDSIGLAYSAYTAFLGFEVNEGEYKVMGLAGYGRPNRVSDVRKTLDVRKSRFFTSRKYFNFNDSTDLFITDAFKRLFGHPCEPGAQFTVNNSGDEPLKLLAESQHFADIAASVQVVTEEAILSYVQNAVLRTGVRKVAMAGGVALNSLANSRLSRELGVDLYVHPAAGDAGAALGAALWHYCVKCDRPRPKALESAYLGGSYDSVIEEALKTGGFTSWHRYEDERSLIQTAAEMLVEGRIIGWFQGRSEWGPRALGARSILSRPFPCEIRDVINERIKFREQFRPFAPAVLAECAHEYFEMAPADRITQPETYMLSIANVRREQQAKIPAVTHVDGSARLQLVWSEQNSRFRRLLEAFSERTGIPVVLNTSFNTRGEPIVETPYDALLAFSWTGLDALVIGDYIVLKGGIH